MFRFRLASVLRHRRREVDAAARAAAAAAAAQSEAARRLALADDRIRVFVDEAARERVGALDPRRLADQGRHLAALWDARARDAVALVAARAQAAAAHERLLEAHRARRALEQLEERQRAAWQVEQERADRRRLDEVASIRAAAAGRQEPPGRRA